MDRPQNLRIVRYQDATIVVSLDPAQSISGWTLTFTVRSTSTAVSAVATKTVGSGITVTDAANGEFEVSLPSAETGALTPGVYAYDVWRTDTPSRKPLVYGTLTVLQLVYRP